MRIFYKLVTLAFVGLVATAATSCKDEPEQIAVEVNLSTLTFEKEGGTRSVTITGTDWEALTSGDWIAVTETADGIEVSVDASEEARSGSIAVRNKVNTKTITVTQSGLMIAVEVNPSELTFDGEGGTLSVAITGTGWSATPSAEWIAITEAEDSIEVTVEAFTETRSGTIIVENELNSKIITVTQSVATPLVDIKELSFTVNGGDQTIAVNCAADWTATTTDAWLTIAPATGTGAGSFTVTAAYNYGLEKIGKITVQGDGKTETVSVTQDANTGGTYPVATAKFYGEEGFGPGTSEFMVSLEQFDVSKGEMGGWRINLDLVCPPNAMDKQSLDITPGTYTVDNSGELMTVDNMFFFAQKFDENGVALPDDKGFYQSGTVTVEGDSNGYRIEFDLTLKKTGVVLQGTYMGPIFVQNPEMWSPFTGDVDLGPMLGAGELIWADDILGAGSYMWFLSMASEGVSLENGQYKGTGYVLYSQLASEMDGEGAYLPDATYTVGSDFKTAGSARMGTYENGNLGTWIYVIENDKMTGQARIVSGTIETMSSGGGSYFIGLNLTDDAQNTITGSYLGPVTVKPYL